MDSSITIDWNSTFAAIWRSRRTYLRPVKQIDPVRLGQLVGIDAQKEKMVANTLRFLEGKPANNAMLWGARGTGKSSLVKALLNEYKDKGLRLIQVDKDDLVDLPEIVDGIRESRYRFIVYCDDISFEAEESGYKALKSAIGAMATMEVSSPVPSTASLMWSSKSTLIATRTT